MFARNVCLPKIKYQVSFETQAKVVFFINFLTQKRLSILTLRIIHCRKQETQATKK